MVDVNDKVSIANVVCYRLKSKEKKKDKQIKKGAIRGFIIKPWQLGIVTVVIQTKDWGSLPYSTHNNLRPTLWHISYS